MSRTRPDSNRKIKYLPRRSTAATRSPSSSAAAAARAEVECRHPDGECGEPLHVAAACCEELAHERRLREHVLVGVAALRAHPPLVAGERRSVGHRLLRASPRLCTVDAEIGERE